VRDDTHPDLIRPCRLRTSHGLRLSIEPAIRAGLRPIDARHPAPHAPRSHQPFHAPTTHAISPPRQGLMNPGTAIRPAAALEDRTHGFEEIPVLPPTRTHRPAPPRVEPRPRNRKQPTE